MKKNRKITKKKKNTKGQLNGSVLRMKYARAHFNLNQTDFAEPLDISNNLICGIEAGKKEISKNVMIQLAEVYNINPNWILFGKGNMFLNKNFNQEPCQWDDFLELEPALKKLIWYCKNSPFVKHSILGYFFRLLRRDKTIIEDDIKIYQASRESQQPGIVKIEEEKEELNNDLEKNKNQGHHHVKIKKS